MRIVPVWALMTVLLTAPASEVPAQGDSVVGAPRVVLETSMGEIVLELDPDRAPATVENFLRYVKARFYEGTLIHRVVPDFLIQGGGYTRDLTGKLPLYPPIKLEAKNGLKNERGTIAMARGKAPDSATSQFFINVVDNPFLDFDPKTNPIGHAVFGRVVKGMDVVDKIRSEKLSENPTDIQADGTLARSLPVQSILIHTVRLVTPPSGAGD